MRQVLAVHVGRKCNYCLALRSVTRPVWLERTHSHRCRAARRGVDFHVARGIFPQPTQVKGTNQLSTGAECTSLRVRSSLRAGSGTSRLHTVGSTALPLRRPQWFMMSRRGSLPRKACQLVAIVVAAGNRRLKEIAVLYQLRAAAVPLRYRLWAAGKAHDAMLSSKETIGKIVAICGNDA